MLSLQQLKHEVDICGTRLIELQVLRNDLNLVQAVKEVSFFRSLWNLQFCSKSRHAKQN